MHTTLVRRPRRPSSPMVTRMPLRQFRARGRGLNFSQLWSTAMAASTLSGSANSPRAAAFSRVASTSAGMAGKADAPGDEFADRDLVGGIEHRRRRPARRHDLRAPAAAPGSGRNRAPRKSVGRCAARSSRGAGPSMRSGQARQCAIGTRMSGGPSCAITEPSRNSTSPCTTDCGCTSTSISFGRHREQMMRLDQLEALVHQARGIDGDLRPHRPIGMAQRLLGRGGVDLRARPGAERAARGGEDDALDVLAAAGAERLEDRVVLGIDRQHGGAGLGRRAHEQAAGADQALFVGERDGRAALDRRQRRLQSDRAADRAPSPSRPGAAPLRPAPRRRRRLRCRCRRARS